MGSTPSSETVQTQATLRAESRAEGLAQSPAQEVDSEPIWVLEGRQAPRRVSSRPDTPLGSVRTS